MMIAVTPRIEHGPHQSPRQRVASGAVGLSDLPLAWVAQAAFPAARRACGGGGIAPAGEAVNGPLRWW